MIIKKSDNKLNLLDVGSGTGMFLNCCYEINNNLNLYGIELMMIINICHRIVINF